MTSKLFHAVVGVGISLGGAAACGGSTDSDAEVFGLPDADASHAPYEGGANAEPVPDAGVLDAMTDAFADALPDVTSADAAPLDAAPDVPTDAIVEAFCDVAWPITKAGRAACGPIDDCKGLSIPWCLAPDGQGACKLYLLECVGAQWQCMGGVTPTHDPESSSCQ